MGKSKSTENPNGIRKRARDENGAIKEVAPRSLRKKGRRWLEDCKQEELEKIGLA